MRRRWRAGAASPSPDRSRRRRKSTGARPEERAEPLHERVEAALRRLVPESEPVLDEEAVRAPDLADAPSGHDVARLDDGHRDHSRIAAMSAHGFFIPPLHDNEPVLSYAPGTPERAELQARLRQMENERISIPMVIGGKDVHTSETFEAVEPHRKSHVLADVAKGGPEHVEQAIAAANTAHHDWSRMPWHERAAIFLRAAELLAGPWRSTLNAATMLNQSKTAHQAEIDAVCEMFDFWRYNVDYILRVYAEQPHSPTGIWNRMEYRPLEGFVFAVSPFNFTCIGGNLSSTPALMGCTVVWKPASTAALSAYYYMRLLQEAGLPGRRHQPRLRLRLDDRERRAREPRSRRDPLHRLDRGLQRHVGDRRHERRRRRLSRIPAPRRRDGREGLHPRASLRGRRGRRDGDRARVVRVPGAEVLGGLAPLHPFEPLARGEGTARRGRRHDKDGRPGRLRELHGRGHRRERLQDPFGRDRRGEVGRRRDRHGRIDGRLRGVLRRSPP